MLQKKKIASGLLLLLFLVSTGFKVVDDDDGDSANKDVAIQKAQQLFGKGNGSVMRLSLHQCLERALAYHADLRAADFSIEQAREKKNEVSRLGYPIVDYEYNLAPAPKDVDRAVDSFFSGDLTVFNKVKIGVGVPIHTFGKVKVGKELADTGIAAEEERKVQKKSDIVLKVKQLYYGILLAGEVERLLQSAHNGLQKELGKREKQGGADPSQLLKLKLFRADLEKRIEEGDKKSILAREAMRLQIGFTQEDRFDLSGSLQPSSAPFSSYEAYRKKAVQSRSDLKLLNLGYQAKQDQLALEKRLMAPNLAVGAFFELGRAPGVNGVTTTDDFSDPFNFTRAGIGFQLKGQLDVHTSMSKIRQLRSEVHKIEIQKELAERGVELDVKEAFLDVRNTKMDIVRAEEAQKLSRQLLFMTQSNNDIGIGESKDLIDALQSFLQTRGQYFEAVFNHNVAIAKLDQKIGKLPGE